MKVRAYLKAFHQSMKMRVRVDKKYTFCNVIAAGGNRYGLVTLFLETSTHRPTDSVKKGRVGSDDHCANGSAPSQHQVSHLLVVLRQ